MWWQIVWPCSVTIGKYQPFLYVACRRPKTDGSSLVHMHRNWPKNHKLDASLLGIHNSSIKRPHIGQCCIYRYSQLLINKPAKNFTTEPPFLIVEEVLLHSIPKFPSSHHLYPSPCHSTSPISQPTLCHHLPVFLTIKSIVHHILDIPDQGNSILHLITPCKEIANAVNNKELIPSEMAVVTLAKIICVHSLFCTLVIGWLSQFSLIWRSIWLTKNPFVRPKTYVH